MNSYLAKYVPHVAFGQALVIDESDGVVPDRSRNKEWPNIATSISPKLVSLDIARRGQAKTIVSPHQLDQGLLSTALLLVPHVDVVAGDIEETRTAHVHNLSVHPEVLEHLLLGHLPRLVVELEAVAAKVVLLTPWQGKLHVGVAVLAEKKCLESFHRAVLILVRDKHTPPLDIQRSCQVLHFSELGKFPPNFSTGNTSFIVERDGVETIVIWQHITDASRCKLVILGYQLPQSLFSVQFVDEANIDVVSAES